MSSEQASAVSKKTKKVIEQWADTPDAYVNKLYKKLRNGQKKLNDIQEVEKKLKTKEIQATPELLEKVQRKDKIKGEMDEVLGYLELYKESFPENPAFAAGAKKAAKKVEAAPQQVVAPLIAEPAVDVSKVVEEALSLVADAVIFGYLNREAPLTGVSIGVSDSLVHLTHAWAGLTHGAGNWSSAKGNFVDTFSRLVNKSATQVGSNTSKSFSEIHAFLTNVAATEGEALLAKTRSTEDKHQHHHHHHDEEEKGVPATSDEGHTTEGGATETTGDDNHHHRNKNHHHRDHKEGEEPTHDGAQEGSRGNRRGGRGGYRGNNNYRKHNQDEEGFQVVKQDEAHHHHYNSKRPNRGGFRGGRGGQRGGEGGDGNTHRGGRGGQRGEGRPWTAREHKNAGEIRKTDPEHPAGEETGPSSNVNVELLTK